MTFFKRLINIILLMLITNIVLLFQFQFLNTPMLIVITVVLSIFYIVFNIKPRSNKRSVMRLKLMIGGHELILSAAICSVLEIPVCIYIFSRLNISMAISIISLTVSLVLLFIIVLNGYIRIIFTSTQLGVVLRVLLILMWWVPVVNIIIIWKSCHIVRKEYMHELVKQDLFESRKENEVCKTQYPILLVHGIFFRDWQLLNYWGRIPKELIRNGAEIYYGNQQSAAAIELSAIELRDRIMEIIESTNCGKLNIIAHSKGGLDSRYAISCLGMDKYVASLTTVNTPHRGCNFADRWLKKLPDKFVQFVSSKYDSTFKKLGDASPDFYSGICDLTASKSVEFNNKAIDKDGIFYQSYMSKMKNMTSAAFPLNICNAVIHRIDGDNDGLVSTDSARWGDFHGVLSPKGTRGISHADMIDLMRENINGFDVSEFYVDIVKGLKDRQL